MSFSAEWEASRRLNMLRGLVDVGGSAYENLLVSLVRKLFPNDPLEAIRADLLHLKEVGGVTVEMIDFPSGGLPLYTISERGEEAAHGRAALPGVEKSRWRRR